MSQKGSIMTSETYKLPFSLWYATLQPPVSMDDQNETVGAETEVQTGRDGTVRTDMEEDADTE
ncbi:hypothetical protein [Tengunoibacter tsumagoiensis]|uniref:Uncharacterized protein n=1 Tax=Tengunoibacter tsumagoiensis TaxID=2014871 RepID=A0A402A0E7_9CHLR|nr:hypothetical protein [Tengunoibacter tsumagoiensis]GCE12532.1 hypothetical protein KTT_23910 [Tengunoibacter tsumagoiensis]